MEKDLTAIAPADDQESLAVFEILLEQNMEVTVKAVWDDEAHVWVAESDDVPGLVLESGSLDALIERLRYAVPEMLELNDNA